MKFASYASDYEWRKTAYDAHSSSEMRCQAKNLFSKNSLRAISFCNGVGEKLERNEQIAESKQYKQNVVCKII